MHSLLKLVLAAVVTLSSTVYADPACPFGLYTLIPASQRPATRNCDTLGYLTKPNLLANSTAKDQDGCVAACKNAAGCVSFGYTAASGACSLYRARLIDMGYRKPKVDSGTHFANIRCYKCTCPTSGNFVLNGGFETAGNSTTDAADWVLGAEYGTIQRGNKQPWSGNWDLNSEALADRGPIASAVQTLTCLQAGKTYALSISAAAGAGDLAYVNAFVDGALVAGVYCDSNHCQDGTYISGSGSLVAQASTATLSIDIFATNRPYVLIDDVNLMAIG